MAERTAPWTEGQLVTWPKVTPYTLIKKVGEAGNIHISEIGHWHVYWHRTTQAGRTMLIHHGGPNGFSDIKEVKHQHERVILRYVGISIDLAPNERQEVEPEQTFPEIARGLQTLEIPGEQQTVNGWIRILQDTTRDIPRVRDRKELSTVQGRLESILHGSLARSVNMYKRGAAVALAIGLSGERANLLAGVTEAQRQLLFRVQETVAIVTGTMQRYDDVEAVQITWNNHIRYLPRMFGRATAAVAREDYQDSRKAIVMSAEVFNPGVGAFARLRTLVGEPYKSLAQEFIKQNDPIARLWEERNYQQLELVLKKQAELAEIWKTRVEEEMMGIDFGKYAIS